ncbi:MAG: endonuclease/exonuclease/phosphatase family protein [Longimicrobiales bacterium]
MPIPRGLSIIAALLLLSAGACSPRLILETLSGGSGCRALTVIQGEVSSFRWFTPGGTAREQLNSWCAAVGPAVYYAPDTTAATAPVIATAESSDNARALAQLPLADSVLFVSWNNAIGAGDLHGVVEDLRAGRLTGGGEVTHFVLLLQEVYRAGADIPDVVAGAETAGEAAFVPGRERREIIVAARELGLYLLYVPSMRSGDSNEPSRKEDRGNAIMSSLPLTPVAAIELPVMAQRRVVPVAHIDARSRDDRRWTMQVASLHLDHSSGGLFRNPERARLIQAETFLAGIPDARMAAVGGDLNTWRRGPTELIVHRIAERYPHTPPIPPGPTYVRGAGVVREYLDYLFFRVPDGDVWDYQRVPDLYGSDHFPFFVWVRPLRPGAASQSANSPGRRRAVRQRSRLSAAM